MQRCNTCRHWDKDGPRQDAGANQRACLVGAAVHHEGDDAATVASGEPFNGGILVTGPLYGCVHHRPNDRVEKAKASRGAARCTWPTGCNDRATHQHRTSPGMRLCAYHYDTCQDGKPKAQNWEQLP